MKRSTHWLLAIGLITLLGLGSTLHAQNANPDGTWYCPRMGQMVSAPPAPPPDGGWNCPGYRGGPGAMGGTMAYGGRGYGAHPGHGPGPGPGYGRMAPAQTEPVTQEQAKKVLENYVASTGNANLKLGGVAEKDGVFEGRIVTKDDSLVDTIQVNKETGWIRFVR
ncbi:MAG: hypothetical protein AUK55_03585 [Syntrophobacteraceae bacterium CG2_30_61_12]|nr:MAG: hypothetical protein AUK55_03585 [Syntrophobacteraceae bacterium CG2_30_61_12]